MAKSKFESVEVIDLVSEFTDNKTGLAYVPDMLRGAVDIPKAHKSLIKAAQLELIELRPDSGSRFSKRDLALAPEGPEGSRLLWARLI
jgi:hypothetical protein